MGTSRKLGSYTWPLRKTGKAMEIMALLCRENRKTFVIRRREAAKSQ
jgi:hypothetical protein